jgi:metal-dependent amidase/aminoacylase/carboxypeptidase family protein
VPAHSAGTFIVRAEEDAYLDELMERVLNCFVAAATATGARLEYRWEERYAPLKNNLALAKLFRQNMQSLGRKVLLSNPTNAFGSTDMGNVSQLVPAIHPDFAIVPGEVTTHSPEFAQAAASEAGIKGMLDSAKTLAMTVADLLSDPATVARIKREFGSK